MTLGARGVGLFRTEFLFLERECAARSEDEQVAAYTAVVVEAFGGDPVTIRLLDIGGDKPIPYLSMPAGGQPVPRCPCAAPGRRTRPSSS